MIEQMKGSRRRGSVKTRERRKKRRNIFQKDSNPAMKVNSVKNAEMSNDDRRTTAPGHIIRMLSDDAFCNEVITLANII